MLTGTVWVAPAVGPDDARVIVIKDIQSYRVWSNPQRPLLEKNDGDQGVGKKGDSQLALNPDYPSYGPSRSTSANTC